MPDPTRDPSGWRELAQAAEQALSDLSDLPPIVDTTHAELVDHYCQTRSRALQVRAALAATAYRTPNEAARALRDQVAETPLPTSEETRR